MIDKIIKKTLDHPEQESGWESYEGYEVKDSKKELENLVDSLLDDPKMERIDHGKGRTANVVANPEHPDICFKIIYKKFDSNTNTPKKEAELLDKVSSLNGEVRVPEPFFPISSSRNKNGKDEAIEAFAMKRIKGMSLEDIIRERKFPEGVELKSKEDLLKMRETFQKVKDFARKMNEELKISHRDLHLGNIMLDENGHWWIIDFGQSAQEYFQEDIDNADNDMLESSWKKFSSFALSYLDLQK